MHRHDETGSEKLIHGELTLDGHKFFVCDEFAASRGRTCKAPETLGGKGVRITLLVDDADRLVERAVATDARVSMPVQDMFWGGRYGKIGSFAQCPKWTSERLIAATNSSPRIALARESRRGEFERLAVSVRFSNKRISSTMIFDGTA